VERNAYRVFYVVGGRLKERGHLEDKGIDGRIILKLILKRVLVVVRWICLAQDRDRWWVLMNTVTDLWVPQKLVISRLAEELLASQGFSSMEVGWLALPVQHL
jgi:hypothetical protein